MEGDKYSLGLGVICLLMAVFIINMLCSVFYMKSLPVSDGFKFGVYSIHKACGITVFGLVVVCTLFRAFTCILTLPASFSQFEINTRKIVHFGLCALMILVPLSGYVMSSASGREIKYFFHTPLLIIKNKGLVSAANGLHSILAYLTVFFIALYISTTLKHALIGKRNTFKRIM